MLRKLILPAVAATLAAGPLWSGNAAAIPISFTISGMSFAPSSGYGVDASETSGDTLLDVRFAASAPPSTFSLDLPTPSSNTFLFGTVDLQEPNAGGGIDPSETDDLGVTANFIFTSPLGTSQNLAAVGTATTGSVADSHVDYTLTFAPVLVNFGNGGAFRIDLSDLSFVVAGPLELNGTVTLLAAPEASQVTSSPIPEPASLSLAVLGLMAVGAFNVRARKR